MIKIVNLTHVIMIFYFLLGVVLLDCCLFIFLKLWILCKTSYQWKRWGLHELSIKPTTIGFFHPYCNAGGGGERVLWQSICALQKRYSFIRCVVYTGYEPDLTADQILNKVYERFGIHLCDKVEFVSLNRRRWVEASCWPRFTILGQSVGSFVLGFEALIKFAPNVFMDTTGYAFVLPIFRWVGSCKAVSYVHYPTVSQDMLDRVRHNQCSYNNSNSISQSKLLTNMKLIYYRLYAKLYGFMGRRSDIVMVNSTWTHGHISKIWKPEKLFIVYPPCDTTSFQQLPIQRDMKKFSVVSIGQFRPEKDHELQLAVWREFMKELDNKDKKKVELVLVGSCRNKDDMDRVKELRQMAKRLGIYESVRFEINVSFQQLKEELSLSKAALHTMWNEHFGIGLVECMAAGCVMIGHNSGGPQMDIIIDWKGQKTGFLATAEEQYVSHLLEVFHMNEPERLRMVSCAREAVRSKFSVEVFEASFLKATEHLFT